MRWRLRSVRSRIVLLVLVPVLSLIVLYVFATSITAKDAVSLARASTVKNATGEPTGMFVAQLDPERLLAMIYLSAPTEANLARLELQEAKTTAAAGMLRRTLTSAATMKDASGAEKQAIAALLRDLARLRDLHAQVAAQIITRQRAFATYNGIVADTDLVLNGAIRQQTSADLVAQALALVRMGKSEEMMLQEDALLTADLAARSFPPADLQQFTELAGARRAFYDQTLPDLDPAYRAYYTHDVSPQGLAAVSSLENTVVRTRPGALPPLSPLAWEKAVKTVAKGLSVADTQSGDALVSQARATARATYLRLIVAGGAGLLAVLVSIIMSVVIGRRQVRELGGLRQSALELANTRLPDVVAMLAAGQHVDVRADAPEFPARTHEVAQVSEAFAKVQQTAVEAAVGQARLRHGINDIFRNLARRSQSLLHRQLALLDAMERRADDPQELEDLFRVDHLATRMRRHAESLIILSGDSPARGWRHPVPLVDVLRAAVAEVEDYTRIKVTAATQASLVGPAVGDVIHMIAELAENATIYSPPQTPVAITGSVVGQGFAVEIEDRGLGMSGEHRAKINERLQNPPAFDLSGGDQLGLFVAGQLAKRHNIRISLRASPYGGTTAIVLIPHNLVVPEGATARETAAIAAPGATAQKARHAITGGFELADPDGQHASQPAPAAAAPPGAWPEPETGTADWPEPETGTADWAEREAGLAGSAGNGDSSTTAHPGGSPGTGTLVTAAASNGEHHRENAREYSGDGTRPGTVSTGSADSATQADLDENGLPRRIRQASLAPQLRESPARPPTIPDLRMLAERSPEETRVTMSAIQRGWERGRSVFDTSGTDGEAGAGDHADGIASISAAEGSGETAGAAAAGIPADAAAGRPDGEAESGGTHHSDD
jgi:signal transduction histidine kinase